MDRSDDPIKPLLHELTFQAMVMNMLHDKIDISNGKIYMSESKEAVSVGDEKDDENNNTGKKLCLMPDKNDEIWVVGLLVMQ